MKRTGKPVFFIVAILLITLTITTFTGFASYYGDTKHTYIKGSEDIRWGIDISGGVEAIFSPDVDTDITKNMMDAAREIIETRLVNKNITDYEVFADYTNHQVIVRFPWSSEEEDFNPQAAVAELGETALLTFCEGEDNEKVILTGSEHVKSATAGVDDKGNYIVSLDLTSTGKTAFAEATARLIKQTISIWLDDELISAPTVNEAINDGKAMISGNFDAKSANQLADKINAGSLPFALSVDDSKLNVVSPTLGAEALDIMTLAGGIAFILICITMILKYRLCGVVASIALIGQIGLMIACISGYFPGTDSFTLTIPGIAGIILSIGMGVDANVITSERIKDEFRKGKTIDGAIATGYAGGWNAIFDGNITIVIIAFILMGAFGSADSILAQAYNKVMPFFSSTITGSVYSFGYSLLIGIIANFIMGVWCSKLMTKSISRFKIFRNPWLYGGTKENV